MKSSGTAGLIAAGVGGGLPGRGHGGAQLPDGRHPLQVHPGLRLAEGDASVPGRGGGDAGARRGPGRGSRRAAGAVGAAESCRLAARLFLSETMFLLIKF